MINNSSAMNRLPSEAEGCKRIPVRVGGLYVSSEQVVLDTVLGSCISACLYDETAHVGGMNHFMLPESADGGNLMSARYGVFAMEVLINQLMKAGGVRARFKAKIFGGGHVLRIRESIAGVPQRNIEFVHRFLAIERIPIVGEDTGGYRSRRVLFYPQSGNVMLKRLGHTEDEQTTREEADYLRQLRSQQLDGEATLF